MTVGELREVLKDYPDDMKIVLSKDEEGNGFSPLYDCAESMYFEDHYECQTYVMDEYIGTMGYTEEDRAPKGAEKVIILWP